eukprot:TRINITY_DN11451_c0_g1_i1.p1 TRINITY_DN11451_c0_g1~~TRINITY_DN11451_c0_g1_i1.p1  ORF type:complete len:353 (+),score=78.65 TRINITY_DN11451_c0_g1_i1:118-1176(+)
MAGSATRAMQIAAAVGMALVIRICTCADLATGFLVPTLQRRSSQQQSLSSIGVAPQLSAASGGTFATSSNLGHHVALAAAAVALGSLSALLNRRQPSPASRSLNSRRGLTALAASASDVGVVLLSGGVGKRMGANIPKQYLKLMGLEIVLHSLDTFLECGVAEIAIVCGDEWRSVFEEHIAKKGKVGPIIKFTGGGKERQDSVKNGLAQITSEFAAIHDGARPLVTKAEVEKVIDDARKHGAALLAVQTKATVKQASIIAKEGEPLVAATPNRKLLWEAHTPQVIRADLLRRGFDNAAEKNLEVTDDVSLIECLNEPVKLTEGEYTNIKVTTPEDMAVAEAILKERGYKAHD